MKPRVTHLTHDDYSVSKWSGGKTVQLAIAPEGANYAERDFLWRLSSATVELETTDFTPLPDYDRLIVPLQGCMHLTHKSGMEVDLSTFCVHRFDGADETRSRGRCTDFNLMMRKGLCQGDLQILDFHRIGKWDVASKLKATTASSKCVIALYCLEGHGQIHINNESVDLLEGHTVIVEGPELQKLRIASFGCFKLILAEIWY